jgi:hypothetical protein
VRCGCRRLRERWQCHRVQAELQGRGLSRDGGYEGATALRLLPCTAQCKSAKVRASCICGTWLASDPCVLCALMQTRLARPQEAATVAPKQRRSGSSAIEPGQQQRQQQEQQQREQHLSRRQRAKDRGSTRVEDVGPTTAVANKLR